jgi:hypothetical protein
MRFPLPPQSGNMAGESKNGGWEENNDQFAPKDTAAMEGLWPRPPPPKTDGLGTSRCGGIKDPYGNKQETDEAEKAAFEEMEALVEERRDFARKHGLGV